MKGHLMKQQKQSGFAHLVIIVAVAVLVIGALGFVFWNNFMQPNSSNDKPVTKTISIQEWGVESDYVAEYNLSYRVEGSSALVYTDGAAGRCATVPIGIIQQFSGTGLSSKPIGNNYYDYTPMKECYSEGSSGADSNFSKAVKDMQGLRSTLKSM